MDQVRARVGSIEWLRALRYSGVSVLATVCTQILLLVGHAALGVGATTMNVLAVMLTSIPAYVLNRRWVWQVDGRSSLRREIVPFWAFTVAGLVLSTLAVAAVAAVTDSSVAVSLANVTAFGVLWVAKFFVLDDVVFAPVLAGEELVAA